MKTIRPAVLLLALMSIHTLAITRCSAQASSPLRISEGGLIIVEVVADDTVKGSFILDTGAGIHVFSDGFLRKLRSVPAGRFTGFRHTGERVDFGLVRIRSLSIGTLKEERPYVASWSVLDSFGVDGIVSAMLFKERPVTIDLSNRLIVVESDASLAQRVIMGQKVPLKLKENRGRSVDLFADFRISDTLSVECIIDTGSPGTVLDVRFAPALNIDLNSREVEKRERKNLFGSVQQEWRTVLPGLSLASSSTLEPYNKKVTFKNNLIYDGLVGNDFWIGRIVTIHVPQKYLIVAH